MGISRGTWFRGSSRHWNHLKLLAVEVRGFFSAFAKATRWIRRCVSEGQLWDSAGSGPQEFFIGDHQPVPLESVGSDGEDVWLREAWGAYGPPEVAQLKAVTSEDETYYQIVGAEAPLEVGWDLFGGYLDGLRLALVHEEYEERDPSSATKRRRR